jgi:hypothetical protein
MKRRIDHKLQTYREVSDWCLGVPGGDCGGGSLRTPWQTFMYLKSFILHRFNRHTGLYTSIRQFDSYEPRRFLISHHSCPGRPSTRYHQSGWRWLIAYATSGHVIVNRFRTSACQAAGCASGFNHLSIPGPNRSSTQHRTRTRIGRPLDPTSTAKLRDLVHHRNGISV